MGEYVNALSLYPDARPGLQELRDAGYFVGIAGNQTTRAGQFLRELNLPVDLLATSDDWGVAKPDVAFFEKLIEVSGHRPDEIAYVGDRLDNDVAPAVKAGLFTVWIRRGPWGFVQDPSDAAVPDRLRSIHPGDVLPNLAGLGPRIRKGARL